MTDSLALPLAALEGVLLGLFFFGGLWWTVRRAFDSPRPALWVGGSLLLRMGCTAGGFIFVSAGDWQRLLACVLGFWAARWLVLRMSSDRSLT
ncbi:MAG: ATP synthase subunit I [Pseudomonadota bacterium]|nr:ATP synthase subunit I [Pseudomonadota bacterium]